MSPSHEQFLTDKNYEIYAAKHYSVPRLDEDEFREDLSRLKYIRKLLTRYEDSGDLKERLILNHFVVLVNVFGPRAACRLVFLRLRDKLSLVVPFMAKLGMLPPIVMRVGREEVVDTSKIIWDRIISDALDKIGDKHDVD